MKQIALTNGVAALVDDADFEQLSTHKWHAVKKRHTFYAARSIRTGVVLMHRQILEAKKPMLCDHINHNGLDNRRCNLRLCNASQNSYNRQPIIGTSSYKGVYWDRDIRKWRAKIKYKSRTIHIGCYDYEQDAAIAYDDVAIELFGEFAYLNFANRPELQQWLRESFLFDTGEFAAISNEQKSTVCQTAGV